MLRLKVKMNYDQNFGQKFGNDTLNVIRRLADHATNIFLWPSLAQPLHLEVEIGQQIPKRIFVADGDM